MIEHHLSLQELFPFFESGMEAIKTTLMDMLKRESIRHTWQCGDHVEILEGAFPAHPGRLLTLDLNLWSAEVAVEAVPAESDHSKQSVSLDGLQCSLMNGDSVLVVAGQSVGRRGLVIQVELRVLSLLRIRSYKPGFAAVHSLIH
jgi:ribosomal protein L24